MGYHFKIIAFGPALTGNNVSTFNATTTPVDLKADTITAAKFDESTAFPIKSADTGATAVARIGTGSDTLKSLSDKSDSVLARLGTWAGTGVNTVLGAFKALLSKAATLPTDIGGTFDPATDSTEAIRDQGDAAWVGAGLTEGQDTALTTTAATVAKFDTMIEEDV